MAHTNRTTTLDLEENCSTVEMPSSVETYNFFQLVELLHNISGTDPESQDWERKAQLVFTSSPSLAFASSDVSKIEFLENRTILETRFLGLTGADSPLPSFYLEQIATENKLLRKLFLDFFNNRILALCYRIWRKYRYHVRFKESASDAFSAQLFSFVGIASEKLRGTAPIHWSKILAYSGILTGSSRSPQVVSGILEHYFDLKNVSVLEWCVRKVQVPKAQQTVLGIANCLLGENIIVGKRITDCRTKFLISIEGLTLTRFKDFLPIGKDFSPIIKLVEFVLKDQMAFDLKLSLKLDEVPPLQLSTNTELRLGWTMFMGRIETNHTVTLTARQ